jgi:Rieske Fe-S protein
VVLGAGGAAGASLLPAGCQVYYEPGPAASPSGPAASSGSPGPPAALARLADIPIGGGTVFPGAGVVVTQPEPGRVHAFSMVCTHAGCAVGEVLDGTINCPCHGSRFAVADGSVVAGPAGRPLPELAVTVRDDVIVLA